MHLFGAGVPRRVRRARLGDDHVAWLEHVFDAVDAQAEPAGDDLEALVL